MFVVGYIGGVSGFRFLLSIYGVCCCACCCFVGFAGLFAFGCGGLVVALVVWISVLLFT